MKPLICKYQVNERLGILVNQNETNLNKGFAIDFFRVCNNPIAIPEIVKYLGSQDIYIEGKTIYGTFHCGAVMTLEKIVLGDFVRHCEGRRGESDFDIENRKSREVKKWQNWYKNEYPEWKKQNDYK